MWGNTDAPVIAERTLTCLQDGRQVTVRVHAPERLDAEDEAEFGAPWCCCVAFPLPGLRPVTGADDGEVFCAMGRDSLEALSGALRDVRNVLDRVHEKLGLDFRWAHADDEDWHGVPHWVPAHWGRAADQRLNDAVLREETAMTQDGVGLEAFRRSLRRAAEARGQKAPSDPKPGEHA